MPQASEATQAEAMVLEVAQVEPPVRAQPIAWTLVEDALGVSELAAAIDAEIASAGMVGLDAEWRPRAYGSQQLTAVDGADASTPALVAEDPPLAVPQIASATRAFVIDMLALPSHDGAMDALLDTLRRLMRAADVPKLGFAIGEDLRRLELALPGATDGAESVYDLQRGATRALGMPKRTQVGLRTACEALLGQPLDKSEQTIFKD